MVWIYVGYLLDRLACLHTVLSLIIVESGIRFATRFSTSTTIIVSVNRLQGKRKSSTSLLVLEPGLDTLSSIPAA